jgi:cell division protein FtsZ
MIQFDLPTKKSNIIKVFGIGGGGGNAVNFMHSQGIEGVDFVLCNTDVKALESSDINNKIQLGPQLTEGLGAGADPEIGELATEESIAEITNILKDNTKMVFVTAGMGGGTGTGGAPIVAKVAKDLKILTVGIVTTPFSHEGKRRMRQAEEGISRMRDSVDTILVISNDKLRHQYGNLGFKEAFSKADDVLATATRCITDVINSRGHVIVDFADVCTVMRNGGVAILGSASASGENRAQEAVEKAINSPLLNDDDISGAKWVLINITSAEGNTEHTLDEMDLIQNHVQFKAGDDCDVILGTGYDNTLGDAIGVTIIATGFQYNKTEKCFDKTESVEEEKEVVHNLSTTAPAATVTITSSDEQTTVENSLADMASTMAAPQLNEALMPSLVIESPAIPSVLGFSMRPAPMVNNVPLEPVVEHTLALTQNEMPDFVMPKTEAEIMESKVIEFELEITNEVELEAQTEASANEEIKEESNSSSVNINEYSAMPSPAPTHGIPDDFITRQGITINRKVGSRYMTEDELVEKLNFELQKKAFEERANSLRSFNYNPATNSPDSNIESVPAYLRAKTVFEEPNNNAESLSSYAVNNHEISSRNSFLNGNKPD